MKRFTLALAVVFATLLVFSPSLVAQGLQTGTLTGTVKDPEGLPLPGATVTVTSASMQGERTVATDALGVYILRGLPPGAYELTFEFAGTESIRQTAVVPLGGIAAVDATLRLAGVAEIVQVTADATPPPLASTQNSRNSRLSGRRP